MSLKIERHCDWCTGRAAVALPKSGPLDMSKIGLPEGWAARPAFPHSKIGDQDGQELCAVCDGQWDDVLLRAQQAYDGVLTGAMQQASSSRTPTKSGMSSSFGR